jgi:hypothetical protein
MNIVIAVFTGVMTGLASAALFWWWQARLTRPRVELCPILSHFRLRGDLVDRYQYKIINKGRRPVMDVRITVLAKMPGFITRDSTSLYILHTHDDPWVDTGDSRRFRINPGLLLGHNDNVSLRYFPDQMAESIRNAGEVDLLAFLGLCQESTLQIYVTAVDALTGAQKRAYCIYTPEAIQTGSFSSSADCSLAGGLIVEQGADTIGADDADDNQDLEVSDTAAPASRSLLRPHQLEPAPVPLAENPPPL